jgi:hypothetical protein
MAGAGIAPGVPIVLIRQDGTTTPRTPALVDSGCDATTFPQEWAAILGVDFDACEPRAGITAAGPDEPDGDSTPRLWPAGVDALVMGHKVHLNALFRPGLPLILLGRHDFFEEFKVAFDQRSKTFRLRRY